MCEMLHCFYWRRNWWIWNFFVSSSIAHRQCNKQTPVEGALLCWSFNLLSIFQPRSVSFPYFCIFKLTLMRENYRWSETTASLLGFSTCRSTNRFLQRELCHGEVLYLLLFSSSSLAFLPTTVFQCGNWWHKFSYRLKLLHPLMHFHLQSHKQISVERALPRWSSMSAHVFRLGLTLRPTPVFQCWNWWAKVL